MRRFMKVFGAGFIAAVSGFELTNVIMYAKFGSVYGFVGVLLAIVTLIPLTYLQQAIMLPIILYGEDFIQYAYKLGRKHGLILSSSILTASVVIFMINLIGFSILISILTGIHWVIIAFLILGLVFMVTSHAVLPRIAIRLLSLLSLLLLIYIPLLIININEVLRTGLASTYNISYIDLLALWGAAASPYTLYMQTLSSNDEYDSIFTGLATTIIMSSSIVLVNYIYLYPRTSFSIVNLIEPLIKFTNLSITLYIIGLSSTVLIALASISITCSMIYGGCSKNRMHSNTMVNSLFLTLLLGTAAFLEYNSSIDLVCVDIIVVGSAVIGILFAVPILYLMIHYIKLYRTYRERVFGLNIIYTLSLFVTSLVLGVLALVG